MGKGRLQKLLQVVLYIQCDVQHLPLLAGVVQVPFVHADVLRPGVAAHGGAHALQASQHRGILLLYPPSAALSERLVQVLAAMRARRWRRLDAASLVLHALEQRGVVARDLATPRALQSLAARRAVGRRDVHRLGAERRRRPAQLLEVQPLPPREHFGLDDFVAHGHTAPRSVHGCDSQHALVLVVRRRVRRSALGFRDGRCVMSAFPCFGFGNGRWSPKHARDWTDPRQTPKTEAWGVRLSRAWHAASGAAEPALAGRVAQWSEACSKPLGMQLSGVTSVARMDEGGEGGSTVSWKEREE
eukprot:scaffold2224_cov261-Pinguiococcus_pyrenoidosus.AAC.19